MLVLVNSELTVGSWLIADTGLHYVHSWETSKAFRHALFLSLVLPDSRRQTPLCLCRRHALSPP